MGRMGGIISNTMIGFLCIQVQFLKTGMPSIIHILQCIIRGSSATTISLCENGHFRFIMNYG